MGHSWAEKAESRERILEVAARQIRQGGLDSISIAEIMKAANLIRAQMAERLEQSFAAMAKAMGGGAKADAAVTAWCAMVGAINLSRVFRGTPRFDEILRTVRQAILDLEAATPSDG